MKGIKAGVNVPVFLLFFGIATLEAFESGRWIRVAFWLAIGTLFLVADNLRKSGDRSQEFSGPASGLRR